MDESDDVSTNQESEGQTEFDLEQCELVEIDEYDDDITPNLYYDDTSYVSETTNTELGQDSEDSWHIYTRFARFYDLVRFSSLKKQFTSNTLDAQLYNLSSNDIKALSEALMKNKYVTYFNLTGNELETTGCGYLSDLLVNNQVIERLELSRCKIDPFGAAELANGLYSSVLKTLKLCLNKMEYPGLKSVLEALKTNTYLKKLDLSGNGIKSEHVKELSVFLEINEHLEILNLSKNFLNKERDLSMLMRPLEVVNKTLRVLVLQWNGISGKACANIFKNVMIKTRSLQILDLSCNNFGDVGKIFGEGIKNLTELKHFDLSNNPLTTNDIVVLLNCIVVHTSLRSLGLTHVFVDEKLEKAISNVQSRVPDFNVRVGLYTDIRTNPVDLQTLYLQRLHYLGVIKPKKKSNKVDIGHKLLIMKKEENLEPMKRDEFISTFGSLKIKGGDEVIQELARVFRNTKKKIDVPLMLDKYLELYPDTV